MAAGRPFEFDHFFVLASAEAPEADRLVELGLIEGSRNVHAGQGTSNRRFFFHNAMLELLWVHDAAEAQADPTVPARLWRRWAERASGACPFGLCFRPALPGGGDPPFGFWRYRPAYVPEGMSFAVGSNADVLTEPMLFSFDNVRPDRWPAGRRQPLDHPAGLRELTRIDLVSPYAAASSAELRAVVAAGLIGLRRGADYWIELAFDGGSQGERVDLRPALPLVLRW